MKKKIQITADCTSDLSGELVKQYGIGTLPFSIITERGCFLDREEITANNVFEHMSSGGTIRSEAPSVDECIRFFTDQLEEAQNIIHICMSSEISRSYRNCCEAMKIMGENAKNIRIFDSKHLSMGTGFIVLKACSLAECCSSPDRIITELTEYRSKVVTQFLIKDLENLRRNGRVGNVTYKLCSLFSIHPVFELIHGRMTAKKFYKGDYQNTELRFINSIIRKVRKSQNADPERVYLIHAGCLFREMDTMHKRFEKSGLFTNVCVAESSAAVSCNCGPHSVGVVYVKKQ
jgi:DegV family protein with EDD domain